MDPEKRATIHKLKYIIDKSLIPQMTVQMKKAYSESSSKGSSQELRFVPPAHFNYGPPPKSTSSTVDKKEKIV